MSAKNAAAALIEFDPEIADRYNALVAQGHHAGFDDWYAFVQHIRGCWTLGMVARAANVSEQQVATALLKHQYGTEMSARSVVLKAYL